MPTPPGIKGISAGPWKGKPVPDITRTAELVQEISVSCREQDTGAKQINKAIQQLDLVIQQLDLVIQQLDLVIQQNAGSSEEMAATSEELSSQAEQLESAIAYFKDGGRGAGKAPAAEEERAPGAPREVPDGSQRARQGPR